MSALPSGTSSGDCKRDKNDSDSISIHYELLRKIYTDIDIPTDISPATFVNIRRNNESIGNTASTSQETDDASFFVPFESSERTTEGTNIQITDLRSLNEGEEAALTAAHSSHDDGSRMGERRPIRQKKEPTREDKYYRADREYVKRRSHQKMIWFFRHLNIRHPAAIRMHLERNKHPEFELPNLQCVYPHQELTIACDENWKADTATEVDKDNARLARNPESSVVANMNYYNIYCATPALVERVRQMMEAPKVKDPDYNKKVVSFIADIVGRLLWHSNRIHAVMFAKSDHFQRDCFLLYSRQVEPTPFSMRSDQFYCRRHDSDKYRCIAPQPDLARANSSRVSNESCIYIVGCDITEIWGSFPYEYRITNCRPMKPLYERVKQIDPALLDVVFSPLRVYLNDYREESPYVEVASATTFDILSALLRDHDMKQITADDSNVYREWVERFLLLVVQNIHAKLKLNVEWKTNINTDTRQPPVKQLNRIVLHNVHYRREIRTLRTNRVYYYRNANNFICSHSLLDDRFEDRSFVDENEIINRRPVYFYDIMQLFEYNEGVDNGNFAAMYLWSDASTMIRESAHTIHQYITPDVIRNPPPNDPFYPPSCMSSTDLAIDRMLERAIKHAKKIKLPSSPTCNKRQPKRRMVEGDLNSATCSRGYVPVEQDQEYVKNAIKHSISKFGENRLRDGYTSPTHQSIETTITHNGKKVPVQIKIGSGEKSMTRVEYKGAPSVHVCENLVCAYLIDPTQPEQIRVVPGSYITDSTKEGYIPLTINDRIVRVFCIQYIQDATCLIKPFVYIIFRNMPYTVINNNLIEEMFEGIHAYDGYRGFGIFEDSENQCNVQESHYVDCCEPEQNRDTPLNADSEQDPLRDLGDEGRLNGPHEVTTEDTEDVFESLLSTVDWGSLAA